jgi:outer membrane protein assembly factor BamB
MHKFGCLLFASLLGATCVLAVETKSWVEKEQSDFEKGTLKNLSLRSDGRLSLAPVFREVMDPSISYLWALAIDSKGTLYTGGGSPGASSTKLMALDASGKTRTVAEVPGLQIQAIAIDKSDRVFVATAPDGKVYRIGSDGKPEVFYDPKTKYIWALVFNSRGDLFVATGDAGDVHRVTADGKGAVFFQTEETHARSLAIDSKDNLIVGTEPGGLILRVSPAGDGFVLYQAAKREVTAVAVARDGAIYAAAVGNKTGAAPAGSTPPLAAPPAPAPASASAAAARVTVQPASILPPATALTPPAVAGGSEVYRISTDNYPQKVWSHAQDLVYAIGFDGMGRPVLGAGNKGNIYRIDTEHVSTLLINAAPTQVTAFVTGPKGRLFAATGNVGKVYQVGPEIEKSGTYESDPFDVGFFAYWGSVRMKAEPNGGQVRFETRSGNLDRPQKNWSSWAPVDGATGRVASPSARFLQYRMTLQAGPDGRSPEVRAMELAYMARNVAPVLEEVDITPANYRFSPSSTLTSSSPQTLTLPAMGQRRRPPAQVSLQSSATQSMQYAKGHIGARWLVSDPNSDQLRYKVEIRGAGEQNWTLLKDDVEQPHWSWDSGAYPDGEYILRITASDAPDNAPEHALTTALESERFIIDNTAPQITGLTAARSGGKLEVRWRARDTRSVIRKAEYSRNGGDWVVVEPTTRLSDAPELDYALSLDAANGEQTIAVRVTDEFDNQSVEKTVLRQ